MPAGGSAGPKGAIEAVRGGTFKVGDGRRATRAALVGQRRPPLTVAARPPRPTLPQVLFPHNGEQHEVEDLLSAEDARLVCDVLARE